MKEPFNPRYKIHMKKPESDETLCNAPKSFNSSHQVTGRPFMVTCEKCKKIIEAERRKEFEDSVLH